MCGSMVHIQSLTAEIRRGKKKEERRREKETTRQKYNGMPYSIGQLLQTDPRNAVHHAHRAVHKGGRSV